MDWSAHNAGFVLVAYIVTAIGLVALAMGIFWKDRARAKQLLNSKD